MNFLANLLNSIATFSANSGTQACVLLFFDEPEMPNHMN